MKLSWEGGGGWGGGGGVFPSRGRITNCGGENFTIEIVLKTIIGEVLLVGGGESFYYFFCFLLCCLFFFVCCAIKAVTNMNKGNVIKMIFLIMIDYNYIFLLKY